MRGIGSVYAGLTPVEMYGKPCPECKRAALRNIASRIRKPRGEDK